MLDLLPVLQSGCGQHGGGQHASELAAGCAAAGHGRMQVTGPGHRRVGAELPAWEGAGRISERNRRRGEPRDGSVHLQCPGHRERDRAGLGWRIRTVRRKRRREPGDESHAHRHARWEGLLGVHHPVQHLPSDHHPGAEHDLAGSLQQGRCLGTRGPRVGRELSGRTVRGESERSDAVAGIPHPGRNRGEHQRAGRSDDLHARWRGPAGGEHLHPAVDSRRGRGIGVHRGRPRLSPGDPGPGAEVPELRRHYPSRCLASAGRSDPLPGEWDLLRRLDGRGD